MKSVVVFDKASTGRASTVNGPVEPSNPVMVTVYVPAFFSVVAKTSGEVVLSTSAIVVPSGSSIVRTRSVEPEGTPSALNCTC